MPMFGGQGDGGAAAQEKLRQASIKQGVSDIDKQFAGFTPEFYQKAATDYSNAQTPEMLSDYRTTKNNLTYALARGGMLNSGSAVNQNRSLGNKLSQNESLIANNAQGASNELQAKVNTQKGLLTEQLQSSADPSSINEQALASTSQLRAPSAIQPLGNLFADWSNMYLANRNSQAYNGTNNSIWSQLSNSGYGTVGGGGNGSSSWVQ